MDEAVDRVLAIAEGGRRARPDIPVIFHGGPFDEPDAVGEGLTRLPGISGFFGASSIERLPTERAIRAQVESFKALSVATAGTADVGS
jgi:predicted TIM-barrel enzyme